MHGAVLIPSKFIDMLKWRKDKQNKDQKIRTFDEMNLNTIDELADGLDEKNRSAILKLIDHKTETDMDKVLTKMESMFAQMDNKFERKFDQIDNKLELLDGKFAHVEAKIDTKINTVYWVIGVAGSVLGLILAILNHK